jgi:hypothetical protein
MISAKAMATKIFMVCPISIFEVPL